MLCYLLWSGDKIDAYYGEPDLIVIPEGQQDAPTGKSTFVELITCARFKVTW